MTPHRHMDESPSWRGGKSYTSYGYVRVYQPEHPRASDGYVYEHILVVEHHAACFNADRRRAYAARRPR